MLEVKSKANELDVVELLEDLPEYNLKKGQRGTVVEVFDNPDEAYMIEFVDESGTDSKIADWVLPHQIENEGERAKELFSWGMQAIEQNNLLEASRNLREAIRLNPRYVRVLHNSIMHSLASQILDETKVFLIQIGMLQLIRTLAPNYELAKNNLAIAYLNYGAHEANKRNYESAIPSFKAALNVEATPDVVACIKDNLSKSYTFLGIQAYRNSNYVLACNNLELAHAFNPSERTRHDLGVAYFNTADFYALKGDEEGLRLAIMLYQSAEDCGLILPEVLNNHACALADIGKLEEATRLFESANELSPDEEIIKSNLSKLKSNQEVKTLIIESGSVDFYPVPPIRGMDSYQVAA